MCQSVEGIPSGSLFLDGQLGQQCTKGVVNSLLMVIGWFGKIPMERGTVLGAHADADEVHRRRL